MANDKAIQYGKEKRKPYYKIAQQVEPSCRWDGGCDWCLGNRMYRYNRIKEKMEQEEKEYNERIWNYIWCK